MLTPARLHTQVSSESCTSAHSTDRLPEESRPVRSECKPTTGPRTGPISQRVAAPQSECRGRRISGSRWCRLQRRGEARVVESIRSTLGVTSRVLRTATGPWCVPIGPYMHYSRMRLLSPACWLGSLPTGRPPHLQQRQGPCSTLLPCPNGSNPCPAPPRLPAPLAPLHPASARRPARPGRGVRDVKSCAWDTVS
jgi:hypothetical protein